MLKIFGKLVIAAGLVVGLATPALAWAPENGDEIRWSIWTGDTQLGEYVTRFARDEEDPEKLTVTSRIDMAYKQFFVTFFSYRHDSVEVWQGDRIMKYETETDNNGEKTRVKVFRADDGRLVFESMAKDGIEENKDLIPGVYWRKQVLDAPEIIDAMFGFVQIQNVRDNGSSAMEVAGQEKTCTHYVQTVGTRMGGEVERDLWYGEDGKLCKIAYSFGGREIVYLPE